MINKTIDRQIKSGQDKNVVINKFNQVKYKDIQYFDFDNPVSKLSAIILDEIQYDMLIKYLNDDFKIVRYGFAVDIIQKKWNKKWLTRGIFTCVAAIALIGSYRYISGIVKVSSNVNGKELPIYCVQTDEK
mgnify:FL=1